MSTQLDILALEPFYGGARRHMLETVIRCSRHRWTLLKLPPRRIERRLSVAANWFAEHLKSHWSGRVDILFTSEAMNLASLYRLLPALARQPSVVYFHENQIPAQPVGPRPAPESRAPVHRLKPMGDVYVAVATPPQPEVDLELVNLNTAMAATEIWFNSAYHQRRFTRAATAVVQRHSELSVHDPMPLVAAKSLVMPPPVDLNLVPYVKGFPRQPTRDRRAIFVDTRDAEVRVLNAALAELSSRGEKFRLITVGPVEDLSDVWPRRTISESDDIGHVAGLLEASIVLSVRPQAGCDIQVIRGLQAGCRPVLPNDGIYPALIPAPMYDTCLYPFSVEGLANCLQRMLRPDLVWHGVDSRLLLKPFEAISATKSFDERLLHLRGKEGKS